MKRKILIGIVAVILGILAMLNVNFSANDEFSALALDNIEALASGENTGFTCYFPGSLDCPSSSIKVREIW